MKTFYIRLKSGSNLAREVQEVKAADRYAAFLAGNASAANWGIGNGSKSVSWWVEDFSGRLIGRGDWPAPQANQQPTSDVQKV